MDRLNRFAGITVRGKLPTAMPLSRLAFPLPRPRWPPASLITDRRLTSASGAEHVL